MTVALWPGVNPTTVTRALFLAMEPADVDTDQLLVGSKFTIEKEKPSLLLVTGPKVGFKAGPRRGPPITLALPGS